MGSAHLFLHIYLYLSTGLIFNQKLGKSWSLHAKFGSFGNWKENCFCSQDSALMMQLRNGKIIGHQEQDDRCTVCMDIKYEPITLIPCNHSFCDPCVRTVAQTNPDSIPQCPLCRTHISDCNEDYGMGSRLQDMYPREYEARRITENVPPNTHPLPKRLKWHDLQYLRKILKTFATTVIKQQENIKEILINILFYHLVIEHFGLNSFAALFSITAIGYLSQLYELSRNANQSRWLRFMYIAETIKFLIETGVAITGSYLGYQKLGFLATVPSIVVNES